MGLAIFVALFAAMKFVLLVFNATDAADRWVFELSPAFLLNVPDLQLAFIATILAGILAYLEYTGSRPHRQIAMGLGGICALSLVAGLASAPGDDPATLGRFVALGLLLGIVVLNNLDLLWRPELGVPLAGEAATEEAAVASPSQEGLGEPGAGIDRLLTEILDDTEALVTNEEAEPEETAVFAMEDLETFERWIDLAAEEETAKAGAESAVPVDESTRAADEATELEEQADFAMKDLETFTQWLDLEAQLEMEKEQAESAKDLLVPLTFAWKRFAERFRKWFRRT